MSAFRPAFGQYRVVVSNYNGDPWPAEVNTAFERFVREAVGSFRITRRIMHSRNGPSSTR